MEMEPDEELFDSVDDGTQMRIISKYGITVKSFLTVSLVEDSLYLYWRNYPEKLGCDLSFLKNVTVSSSSNNRLDLMFVDSKMQVEFKDDETCSHMATVLSSLIVEANAIENENMISNNFSSNFVQLLKTTSYQTSIKQELLYQLCSSLSMKESSLILEKYLSRFYIALVAKGFKAWTEYICQVNKTRMNDDKFRWRLHAASNQDLDLQAWYHAIFYQEVYRLRGPFWYRDAVLPIYRNSYDLIDNALTPLEEVALAHVLCSPETSYGDVAGQMFVVQSIVRPELFALFQRLAAQGSQVVKYPRNVSLKVTMNTITVDRLITELLKGNIYLTWRGKFGNQGVDLGEVSSIAAGITTEVLRRSAQSSKSDQYLSVICAGRSVDLCFDTVDERNEWRDLLEALARKEHGVLQGQESMEPPMNASLFEWLLLYSAVGERILPLEVKKAIIRSKSVN